MSVAAPILVLGYGNPGRADDGLGPALAAAVESEAIAGVRVVSSFQLQVEHAAEIAQSAGVVFADAWVGEGPAVSLTPVTPRRGLSFSSHSVSPESVVALAVEVFGWQGPAYLLAMRGSRFGEFGEALSPEGRRSLEAALALLVPSLRAGGIGFAASGQGHGTCCRGSTGCEATSM